MSTFACRNKLTRPRRPGQAILLLGLALLLLACTLSPQATPVSPTPAPTSIPTVSAMPATPTVSPPALSIVYERGGNLWIYDGRTHRALTDDRRSYEPLLSSDGHYLLFRRHEEPTDTSTDPFSLWVLDMITEQSQEIDLSKLSPYVTDLEGTQISLARRPHQQEWLPDGHTIIFNTFVDFSMLGPGSGPEDNLWLADAATGEVRNLFAGEGSLASFTLSPDGQWVLLNRPTLIESYHLESGERRTLLEFPFVATYSEYAWLPEPRWLPDGHQAHVAIAPEEPMSSQIYTLWRLDLEQGSAEQRGEVSGSTFAWSPNGLSWSPDGSLLAYVEATREGGWRVLLADASGRAAVELARGGNPRILGWSDDGSIALYQDGGILYGIQASAQPSVQRLAEVSEAGATPLWLGDELFVATEGRLLQVATDGSGVQDVGPQ